MPTILLIFGWRIFFYSNEGNEPIHVHAQKGDMECKFWLNVDTFEITEAFSYNISPSSKREIMYTTIGRMLQATQVNGKKKKSER